MPGFRPGKVPANLVRKMHGPALHADALDNAALREWRRHADAPRRSCARRCSPGSISTRTTSRARTPSIKVEVEVLPDVPGAVDRRAQARAADRRGRRARSTSRCSGSPPSQKSYDRRAQDAARRRPATSVDHRFRSASVDGERVRGRQGRRHAARARLGPLDPGLRGPARRRQGGRQQDRQRDLPGGLSSRRAQGQGRRLRRDRARRSRSRARPRSTTTSPSRSASRASSQAQGAAQGPARAGDRRAHPHPDEAPAARPARRRARLRSAADDGRGRVRADLAAARGRDRPRRTIPTRRRKEIEAEKDDYHRIAERRVRLGLLLSEIGQANGVEVTQQEMGMLMQQAAQQYRPEDRERFVEYVRNEPMAAGPAARAARTRTRSSTSCSTRPRSASAR